MYKVLYKVMKKDCTSLLGIVVGTQVEGVSAWFYVAKPNIGNYEYENVLVAKNGSLRVKNVGHNRSFTRRLGNIITYNEWDMLIKNFYSNIDVEAVYPAKPTRQFYENLRHVLQAIQCKV